MLTGMRTTSFRPSDGISHHTQHCQYLPVIFNNRGSILKHLDSSLRGEMTKYDKEKCIGDVVKKKDILLVFRWEKKSRIHIPVSGKLWVVLDCQTLYKGL